MKIQPELLRLKEFRPLQKLILGLVLDNSQVVIQMEGGYRKTCSEMGKELGVSRKKVLDDFNLLVQGGYLTTEKGMAWRLTNVTQKLRDLL
ncbi:hypothetical protein ACFQ5N_12595 [Lutibacter holmesii]|uniref:Uncharacterized protein n=1 Tax=Lutibacter holmesii TaxID=1137985 RepID=A0ABW3WRI2_9FLAO